MADENVVQLPTLLERLAGRMKDYLGRNTSNRAEWVEIQEGICLTLAEARDQFSADIEFGQWCESNGFGNTVLDEHARAGAIVMGRQPGSLRECLKATTRQSLRLIYEKEFSRFGSGAKPEPRRKEKKKEPTQPSPQMKKALWAYEELEKNSEPITAQAVRDLAGVSDTPVRRVFALKNEEVKLNPLTPAEMRETEKKRFDLAVKRARLEIREELKAEVFAELNAFVRHHKERVEQADRIVASHRGVVSKDVFRKIKACLHPDHNTFKYAAEALQAFSELEAVLVKPEPPPRPEGIPPLPSTVAELLRRKEEVAAARRAKRAQTAH